MTVEERERRPETPAEADGTTGLLTAVGKMLRLLRERKGLTQKEFGRLVGYGPDAVSAMERGVRTVRPEVLEAEAVALHHYCSYAMHGLLQTEAHAHALFAKRRPFLSEEMIEKRVADRLGRQQVLGRWPAPIVSYVLEEL
ncbi:Scr1 family TA system antitoxin-like transcriptional regulator [Streptomyces antibioticus]|uniref:Scr1 family TA system antitoxin-like transcriptional regulator n=1 Tax=Streptomyces antibioticus TaxID=1890 RepID=UPI0033AFE94F